MKMKKTISFGLLVSTLVLASCGIENSISNDVPIVSQKVEDREEDQEEEQSGVSLETGDDKTSEAAGESSKVCPAPQLRPEISALEFDNSADATFVDMNREIKDIGTEVVTEHLFSSKDTLFNFLKLVNTRMEAAIANYRKEKKLEDRAIFFIFKGGNVLRMVANEIFDQLGLEARLYMQKEYATNFKRSDADFAAYVDEKKLGSLDYETTFNEVAVLIYEELNAIRAEFEVHPEKYFNFLRLDSKYGRSVLSNIFNTKVKAIKSISDPENENWYKARFLQMQLRDYDAKPGMRCFYQGTHDYRYEIKEDRLVATQLTTEPHWIANSDNRTLTWKWGSDPSKTVKFSLLRSKVMFEYTYEKDGVMMRKPVGGELIDISMPHREDDRLREFLDNYDDTVKEYTITSEDDSLKLKAYSFATLVEDLQFIIFDSFDRPWHGGDKFKKRINRLFFLFNVELLTTYGLNSVSREYLESLKEKIVTPLHALNKLESDADATAIVEQIKYNASLVAGSWTKMKLFNHFIATLGTFVERMKKNPLPDDAEGLKNFIGSIEDNINKLIELSKLRTSRVKEEGVYNVETKNLF